MGKPVKIILRVLSIVIMVIMFAYCITAAVENVAFRQFTVPADNTSMEPDIPEGYAGRFKICDYDDAEVGDIVAYEDAKDNYVVGKVVSIDIDGRTVDVVTNEDPDTVITVSSRDFLGVMVGIRGHAWSIATYWANKVWPVLGGFIVACALMAISFGRNGRENERDAVLKREKARLAAGPKGN